MREEREGDSEEGKYVRMEEVRDRGSEGGRGGESNITIFNYVHVYNFSIYNYNTYNIYTHAPPRTSHLPLTPHTTVQLLYNTCT